MCYGVPQISFWGPCFQVFEYILFPNSFTGSSSSSLSLNGSARVQISDLFLLYLYSLGDLTWLCALNNQSYNFMANIFPEFHICMSFTNRMHWLIVRSSLIRHFKLQISKNQTGFFCVRVLLPSCLRTWQLNFPTFPGQNTESCSWILTFSHASHPMH